MKTAAGFREHLWMSVRLNFRNRQAIVFGYVVPVFFLIAFASFFPKNQLTREIGQVLTITALGGACFGMPILLVSERERGVWRRYRLTPLPTAWFVASILLSRFVLVGSAALIQLGLARWWYNMPWPQQPLGMLLAFVLVCFAFLGIGLVIAMVARNIGAVQALGQSLFLPMIIIGGVGVPLYALPKWCRHVAAFLPGKYAVQAVTLKMGYGVTKEMTRTAWFNEMALILIALAGVIAGVKLFRWENERKISLRDWAWVGTAVVVWVVVGLIAEMKGLI